MANIDLEMGQFQKVTTLENKDYIVVSLDNGTQGQIKVSDLASVVAGIVPLGNVNMSANDILQTCVCVSYSGLTDIPSQYGILLTFVTGGTYDCAQIFIQRSSSNLYQRTHHYQDGWGEWYKVQ